MSAQLEQAAHKALGALEQTLQTLDDANAMPGGPIADTIWHTEHETLFDYLASEITALRAAVEQPAQTVNATGGPKAHFSLREQPAQDEPVAMRYDFDGYGWKYIDSGSGSDWQTRIKGAEPVYDRPQAREPEQPAQDEPQYAGTVRELFTNSAIERLDVRPSTKVYLGTPSVCEQPAQDEPVAHCRVRTLQGDESTPMVRVEWINGPVAGPLYTLPQAREPLTDEQITEAIRTSSLYMKPSPHTPQSIWLALLIGYTRAIEAAHGIGEKK